jgi:hypothetical protein
MGVVSLWYHAQRRERTQGPRKDGFTALEDMTATQLAEVRLQEGHGPRNWRRPLFVTHDPISGTLRDGQTGQEVSDYRTPLLFTP